MVSWNSTYKGKQKENEMDRWWVEILRTGCHQLMKKITLPMDIMGKLWEEKLKFTCPLIYPSYQYEGSYYVKFKKYHKFGLLRSLKTILEEVPKILPINKIFGLLLQNLIVHLKITFKTYKMPKISWPLGLKGCLGAIYSICLLCFHACLKNSSNISKGQIWQEVITIEVLHFSWLKKLAIFPKSINKEKNSSCKEH